MSAIPHPSSRPPDAPLLSPAVHRHPRGQRILTGVLTTGLVGGLAGALWQQQSVTVLGIAIATGALVVLAPRVRRSRDALRAELARVSAGHAQLQAHCAHQHAGAAADATLRLALEVSHTAVMIADASHVIRYVNPAVVRLLRNQQATLREAFPDFDADSLVGTSIHRFHANPDRIRAILDTLQATHHGRVRIGPVHFAQVVSPMFDAAGARVGFAVEWHDRTQELVLETAVAEIVDAATRGDLDRRLPRADSGAAFMDGLTTGINQLLERVGSTVGDLRRVLSALAEGDLGQRMEGDYEGSFAAMQRDANATAIQLGSMVERIRRSAGAIALGAEEIASGNHDLSTRTERQAAHLEETASSMEELTATVRQNAEHAHKASTLARGAQDVAESGSAVVGRVVSTMDSIHGASKRIGEITGVIDGIAFQTNILALNAAVEAARAGDQGRGFAVVASEVRSLAQRSAEAAREIRQLIDASVSEVADGARLAQDAGHTMQEIVGSVAGVSEIMASIASASQEQAAGIDQINQTVVQMDEATQQNAALVEEASAAARELEQQAAGLTEAVAAFR
ncbi:methyl-accepting chemotaxis protein [Stenotrophomonas sp. GbtcB23]|uniref:methyl-accepting chemotaxis protein n=1 Tax=Stenotrophomonas sp. GbtcB23 TaxID=2824768 RepID=UPI001C30BC9E|nr:methyl-accepting chemotaxis protein [Stenotrophomonas sp. GbtcB23]